MSKYDYSKVSYVNTLTKVIIICPEHGEFIQTPAKHLQGHGCIKCSHKRRTKWTLEKCKEDALKYKTRSEWHNKSNRAYHAAHHNGWLKKCCKYMIDIKKPNGYWTLEKCKEDALKYNSIKEWNKFSSSAYNISKSNKWLKECCGHMNRSIKIPMSYWTLEKCKEDALKYNGRYEWQKKSRGAYQSAYKNGWLDKFFPKKII